MSFAKKPKKPLSYLITDRRYGALTLESFASILKTKERLYRPDFMLYRDKGFCDYGEFAKIFIESVECKAVLHQEYLLACELGAFGVHLTSSQLSKVDEAKKLGLFVVASTHNIDEIHKAEAADLITYSPIFTTHNKGKPLGLENLNEITATMPNRVIALGGVVTQSDVASVMHSGACGFASIRYFDKDRDV